MPSEQEQLPEPLLDDGGNDRFVLFPLKYDAVWEMYKKVLYILRHHRLAVIFFFEIQTFENNYFFFFYVVVVVFYTNTSLSFYDIK